MSSDGRKRSWFFFPAWRHDDEEGTALVPSTSYQDEQPPPAAADHSKEEVKEDPAAEGLHHCDSSSHEQMQTKEAAAASRSSAWWRVVPATRGVGLVIGGLLILAVLLAITTTWWTHLDYSSSSFLLGSSSSSNGRGRQRERERVPHHSAGANLGAPILFSCGNDSNNNRGQIADILPPSMAPSSSSESEAVLCPDYFRHIHSDLAPWRETGGITREAVESGRSRAAFRLTVVNGRAFVETYHRVFQTRDTFTQWGIAQLLARYPGRVPDLDLMFNCEDMPEVHPSPQSQAPPPLFRYCKDDSTVDIVFPDWSFWGWPEVNIRPWAPLLEEMANETRHLPWTEREPYAYWKGNPGVSQARQDLMRCNGTTVNNALLLRQDWGAAIRNGFKDSNLAKQCRYRYKIFVQGRSWSVSEKYILACDSPVLLVATPFKDFFSRGLVAGKHYWPIDPKRKCTAIKFAVDWGNSHPAAAQRMAHQGSTFARLDLSMDYVYDYMLHLLTEYAKLLRYKPTVPEKAVELRPETIACPARARRTREFDFMMQSRERYVAAYEPCTMPPPFTDDDLKNMARKDKQVRDKVNSMMLKAQKHT